MGSSKVGTVMIITGILLFSVFDEIHQSFVPGRTSSISDIGLDLIGVLIGMTILELTKKQRVRQD